MAIPVIDIFAGPGGLAEGFSSLDGGRAFDIRLSIEKEANEHRTLELRSFVRQFERNKLPEAYYQVMREADLNMREQLKQQLYKDFPEQYLQAKTEAWQCTLGSDEFPPEKVNERITNALNGAKDWILIGGPPCQAYSLVGRSRRQEGETGLNPDDHRVHLYKEYLRIIATHHPTAFVMENVKGLLSSNLGGEKIFPKILSDLRKPGRVFRKFNAPEYKIYSLTTKPEAYDENGHPVYKNDYDYLIQAENFGVPQKRHRVILFGVRADIDVQPNVLNRTEPVSLKDVIGDLPSLRSSINRSFVRAEQLKNEDGSIKTKRYYQNEIDSNESWKQVIQKFHAEIISMNGFAHDIDFKNIWLLDGGTGDEFVPCITPKATNPLFDWYVDKRLKGAANHQSRSHLVQDLKRYLFAGLYTLKYGKFPRMADYAAHGKELLPDHENAESGKFTDRFRVQLPEEPATTITSHISKDGHYFIHYDTSQCRSFTVREAARVQTFPDNYLFCGSRTSQFHQVGNAVPPLLAFQIAEVVKELFNNIDQIEASKTKKLQQELI
ncbi:DNA cytosine methyltransferase [Croceimicrobium hydrocarbonivorans]|uniref:DNA (cytosine-5-)-methyltransferase n=1 Tax=Croceimicrobium hydrocarbonivorans TaxID=2761580 RepID=A0A7H0VD50_9FLAO|nr:DNA (cytosine-5-)-methyltransferase [Croceimicrobium hydrocarbonivorans]QNR23648.1 DNA cytosine methyltransferase [Croceimicrobium hydrocarbonivorans]